MAAQTTALTEFRDNGDSKTYTTAGHLTSSPKLVIQKRRVPTGSQVIAETTVSVIQAGVDANGDVMDNMVSFVATVKYPLGMTEASINAAQTIFNDIVAGDEFNLAVDTQNWIG
jgi:hypothetical protein